MFLFVRKVRSTEGQVLSHRRVANDVSRDHRVEVTCHRPPFIFQGKETPEGKQNRCLGGRPERCVGPVHLATPVRTRKKSEALTLAPGSRLERCIGYFLLLIESAAPVKNTKRNTYLSSR